MPDDPTAVYFDANVFLAYVSNEQGRAATVEALLASSRAGEIRVFTSTTSIVEVAFGAAEKTARVLDAAVEDAIDSLWHPTSPVTLVEPSTSIMLRARGLVRDSLSSGRGRLTPLDAVHLATAQHFGVSTFFTYESAHNRRDQWASLTNLAVQEPFIENPPLDFGA